MTLNSWTLEILQNIDWKLLEDICAAYLDSKNWQVQQTELGADGGVDVLFNSANWTKPTPFGLIQCKARPNWKVPVSAIRELYGVMADRKAELGIFITTGAFTRDALDFAVGKRMQLVDGEKFLSLILALKPEIQRSLLEKHITQDYSVPSCPSCGTKMVARTPKKEGADGKPFWGCPKYPKCRSMLPMRTRKIDKEPAPVEKPPEPEQGERFGYCIRTGGRIPFNIKRPLSPDAYRMWSQYKNGNYSEKFCHFSGEPSNGETSVNRPILKKNWNQAMELQESGKA